MSRVIVGYDQGRAIYRDEGPAYARVPGHRGELVIGGRGSNDRDRQAEYQRRHTANRQKAAQA